MLSHAMLGYGLRAPANHCYAQLCSAKHCQPADKHCEALPSPVKLRTDVLAPVQPCEALLSYAMLSNALPAPARH